jgi:hypothetical protein
VAYPSSLAWPLQPLAWLLRHRDGKRLRRGHRVPVRPRLEVLETRTVPTLYTLPLVNQTGLNPAQESVYVAGFSTASQLELQSNGQFAPFPGPSGTIPSYDISTLPSITLDSTKALIGARLYFFVAPPGQAPTLPFSNNGGSVTQPTNPPNSNAPPFDIVEITQPPGGGLPTIDVQTVDGFIFPLTLTLNSNLGQVGQPLPTSGANRAAILSAYAPFMQGQGAAGAPYQDLVFAPDSIAGQAGGVVNPGLYLASGANPGSALNTAWDSALTTLFQTPGRTVSLIGDDSAYYKGTPTQVGSSWVLHFVGYTDAAETNPNGNMFNIYSPLTRDPLGLYQANESAGEMVFANDGVFDDVSANVVVAGNGNAQVPPAAVVLGLERDLVAALNRGVALLGPTDGLNGDDSVYWGTQTSWYPAGQTENLFAMFMHTGTVNGTPLFALPANAVNDAQGMKMGSAYGFAFDENPGHGPAGQPNVPSKFDPVPAGTTTITVTLGPWFTKTTAAPPGPAPAVSGPQILSLSPIVEGALRRTLTVLGVGFTPGSVLLVNGRPVATRFLDDTHLEVRRFLRHVDRRLPHGRVAVFGDGRLALQVRVPGAGLTPAVPLEVLEAVGPGDAGTAAERAVAERWEALHHQAAGTSPVFARLLRRLRARGI